MKREQTPVASVGQGERKAAGPRGASDVGLILGETPSVC